MSLNIPTLKLNNGIEMPQFGLGTWLRQVFGSGLGFRQVATCFFSDKGQVRAAVEHAISKGYRNVDAAWIYGNEGEVGEAIEAKINDGTVKREDLFVATKACLHKFHGNDGVKFLEVCQNCTKFCLMIFVSP